MSGVIYGTLEGLSLHETARIASSLSAMEIETPYFVIEESFGGINLPKDIIFLMKTTF